MNKNYSTRPLWFWNDTPTPNGIKEIMENCSKKDGYAGFGILPYKACGLKYMSDEYLDMYEIVLQEAERLNLKICLYDEWWFPSGSAGGILKNKYPEACAKRLDLEEYTSQGTNFEIELKDYIKIMAVTAMKDNTIIDLTEFEKDGIVKWKAPSDDYKVLCFLLRDADLGRVDYLDPDSVKKFIACTHDVYYKRFSKYFGNVIDSAFYDEPQFYSARGRAWTGSFNDKFKEKYGFSPTKYYPSLFYDIGEDTAKARNMMFGLRAELYSKGFPKVIQDWCTIHNISLTGHVDQEEVENPCGITGDLMTSFKYQDIPGLDEIFCEGRGSEAYKIVSSSAVNFNKQLVMSECFGAIENITKEGIYRESYDLLTKGVNDLIPHAVWYNPDSEKVKFKPELSYRTEYYGKMLNEYNKFCSSVQSRLQKGGQVNSIAIIYPIENLRYLYNFSWGGEPVNGGPTNDNNIYMKLGQYLIRELNTDFTFLHPDVLYDGCEISNGELIIKDSIHYQNYKAIIIPGMTAVSLKTIDKLKIFVQSGGTLISVAELPSISIENEKTDYLKKSIFELFGTNVIGDSIKKNTYYKGNCYSLPFSKRDYINEILRDIIIDTKIESKVYGLQYIHKKSENGNVWFFASIFENAKTNVILDGVFKLKSTNPITNETKKVNTEYLDNKTIFNLSLCKEDSILIEEDKKEHS